MAETTHTDILGMPPLEISRAFAVETEFYMPALGLHKTWAWRNETETEWLLRSYNRTKLDSRNPPTPV